MARMGGFSCLVDKFHVCVSLVVCVSHTIRARWCCVLLFLVVHEYISNSLFVSLVNSVVSV